MYDEHSIIDLSFSASKNAAVPTNHEILVHNTKANGNKSFHSEKKYVFRLPVRNKVQPRKLVCHHRRTHPVC